MEITIVNGTNRIGNHSMNITNTLSELCDVRTNIVDLSSFTELFMGEYINMDNASKAQRVDLMSIKNADIIIFVVPVYHHGIPASLKNFFDIVELPELYDNAIIGFISANKKSVDGARQASQILSGCLSYFKNKQSYIVPTIPIIDPKQPDPERISDFLAELMDYYSS